MAVKLKINNERLRFSWKKESSEEGRQGHSEVKKKIQLATRRKQRRILSENIQVIRKNSRKLPMCLMRFIASRINLNHGNLESHILRI